jgi:hypothetical protein
VRVRLKTLAKDHLQQAFYILQGDEAFADVRRLIARTLDVLDHEPEQDTVGDRPAAKVLRFRPPQRPASLPPGAITVERRRTGASES